MSKEFSKEFPSLWNSLIEIKIDSTKGLPYIIHPEEVALRIKIFKELCSKIQKFTIDKQRVRDVIIGLDSYMTEQHTIMNDMDISEEFKRGWAQATREIEHRLKKKLGLEE